MSADEQLVARIASLEARIDATNAQVGSLAARSDDAPLVVKDRRLEDSESRATVENSAASDKMKARLLGIETRLSAVERSLEAAKTAEASSKRPPLSSAEREAAAQEERLRVAARQAEALDPSLDTAKRLEALRDLRGTPGARSPAVVAAMIAMAQTSTDAAVRADVWRQMSGAKDVALVPAMLHAVLHDADPKPREEAAETLGDFLDHPGVRETLERVAAQDADADVQRQARRSLTPRRR